jgi:hypothetical protein
MWAITAVHLATCPAGDPQIRHSGVVFLEKVPTFPAKQTPFEFNACHIIDTDLSDPVPSLTEKYIERRNLSAC